MTCGLRSLNSVPIHRPCASSTTSARELLPYATLLTARRDRNATLGIVEAVYEWQGAPLVFLVDADSVEDDNQLQLIRRLLAMRGDAPYLGVVAPGQLRVYRIALDRKSLLRARIGSEDWDCARSTVFARLGNVRPEAAITKRGWISNVVLNLLSGSTTKLIDELEVSHEDRHLPCRPRTLHSVPRGSEPAAGRHVGAGDGGEPLRHARGGGRDIRTGWTTRSTATCCPCLRGIFEILPERVYGVLGDVLRRAPDGQPFLGWEEKWDNLDFAHIPVGVLSQAYELHLREHAPDKQKREGGYFTPRPIADLMVRASFRALERRETGESVRVLDPAVGGGIFLLTAFRELVAERWRADGERPDTHALRQILYEQMVGFDINEAALRFAALGLYLLSIELDPNPRPVDKLRFEKLRGTVLYRVKGQNEQEGTALGSLGSRVGEEHQGRYDLVIGNPPWSSGTKLPEWNRVRETVARIAADREIANAEPPLAQRSARSSLRVAGDGMGEAGRPDRVRAARAPAFSARRRDADRAPSPVRSDGRHVSPERCGTEADEGVAADLCTFLHSVRDEPNPRRRGRVSFRQSADRGHTKQCWGNARRRDERGSRCFSSTCRHTRDPENTVPGLEGGFRNPSADSRAGLSDTG